MMTGLKRSASTPFASPSKTATAKRSRHIYHYNDEEEDNMASEQEDQWSGNDDYFDSDSDTDSMSSEMSLDDDDDDNDDRAYGQPNYRKDAVETGMTDPKTPRDHCKCGTTTSSTKKKPCTNCVCAKQGSPCKPSTCGCTATTTTCDNPFNRLDLPAIFGPAQPLKLRECFVTWVLKRHKKQQRRGDVADITATSLFDRVFKTAEFFIPEHGEWVAREYVAWRARWDALGAAERAGDAGTRLRWELNRLAAAMKGEKGDDEIYYSFCSRNGSWESDDHMWHCLPCASCQEWREWHCQQCNECTYGLGQPCDGCEGVAAGYHEDEEAMNGDGW